MRYNKEQGFSALALLLILIAIGTVGFTGRYVWQYNKNNVKNTQSLPSEQTNNSSFSAIKTIELSLSSYQDPSKSYSLKYPSDWMRQETPPPSFAAGTRIDAKTVVFYSPNAPSLASNNQGMKAGVGVDAYSGIVDPEQILINWLGYEKPGVPYKSEVLTINGNKVYYQKITKGTYTDHYALVLNGATAVTLTFREKQNKAIANNATDFDATADLPVFKTIVSSITFP